MRESTGVGHRVAIVHNHPNSGAPSAADISNLRKNEASFGVIACHDGSILRFEQVREPIGGYTAITKENVGAPQDAYRTDIDDLIKAYETRLGVRIERLA